MARKLILENLMKLAQSIGANPKNFMGTRTNITFLGKGPQRNPLFQSPVPGLETASEASLGPRESIIGAVEDAMGFASAGKLNDIQLQALTLNLKNIYKVYNPPVLPMASVTDIAPGIAGLKRFPRETQKFFGRPLKDKDFSEIDRMVMEGKIPDARGRQWNLKAPQASEGERLYNKMTGLNKPRLVGAPETLPSFLQGPGNITKALDAKTGMSRAIARQILQQDTRIKLKPEELWKMKLGEGEPLELMRKYYGNSMANLDTFLDDIIPRPGMNPRDIATRALSEVELIPQFAEGGLAEILQAPRSGYSKGRIAKNVLAILNRNKKNADYMFKASDNVSPGYAKGDLKYNAELLADQLAEDAGVVYDDLGQLERTEFYGTAYDYLAKEMMQYRQMTKMLTDVEQKMQLSDFSIKGRKPSASGGLAGILEV